MKKRNYLIQKIAFVLLPIFILGQSINNFDVEAEPGYWGVENSDNADPALSNATLTTISDAFEGAGALQIDYSAHNSEPWGGYTKLFHYANPFGEGTGSPVEGTWILAPEAGALQVGPAANNGDWWSNSEEDVTTRACYFDDHYVFNADGSFQNVMDGETWLETWQGVESDQCGTPVAPHDGSNAATWEYDAASGTVTLSGLGAYLGIPKGVNAGQLPDVDVPESVTYSITQEDGFMNVVIETGTGTFWTYKLVPAPLSMASNNAWMNDDFRTLVEMRPRDGGPWDWSGYDSISFAYNNTVIQSLEGRVHLRLNLSDYAEIADPSNYTGLGEYYYSFHYILDSEPGWNTVTLPLVRNDDWGGGGFNLTGWAGETGNGELDKHAIGGFHLEFSVSGGGDGDHVTGTVVLDDFKLTGSLNALTNPGFELEDAQDDDLGWGTAIGGGHAEVVTDAAMAYGGENYLSIGVLDNWAVAYTEDIVPAQFGETWRFSGFGKEVMGDGSDGAAFKLEAKDASGTVLGTTGDVYLPMTGEWEHHHIEMVMPEGTEVVTAVIVASRWDGVEVDYAFDDMFLMSMGILDVVPPAAVGGISAVPASFYNLVTWTDIDGEEGETYHVYASTSPITDINDSAVDVVATNVLEGAQAAVHYLFHPLEDSQVTYYYAVACKDASNNVGEPGASENSITNTAKGVPTISLTPPSTFAADGDLGEWYDSGIDPYMVGATENSYDTPHLGFGAVDDDNDLHGTFFIAVDNDYLYFAGEVLDDVVVDDQSGGWWTSDVVQLCIGLFDQRGPKHVGMERGEEPDYKMYFDPIGVHSDNGAGMLAEHGDGNYFHEAFNPDYVFEFRISLDDIVIDDDVRFTPANGMRIPFEPMIHDNDGSGMEAILVLSPTNNDNAHQTCEVWSSTWVGDRLTVMSNDEEIVANEFALHQNYPNPFNPETTIKFSIPNTDDVNLSVYNMLGQRVVTLYSGELQAGRHITKWHAGDIASGVYIYRLTSRNKTLTQKMLLLK